jgi:D-glycero-D-manno-heptose 1,7-bisphosphate phosphatase
MEQTPIKLYIFDMNGTLTNTPFVDHQPLAILPGRHEKLADLRKEGAKLALATNQGGVAFGFTTEGEAREEARGVQRSLHMDFYAISFGHPTPKRGYEEYSLHTHMRLRKPAPGMLLDLMKQAEVRPAETMMIGDRDEDFEAAKQAECAFMWTSDFFGSEQDKLWHIYGLYIGACALLMPHEPLLVLDQDGSGSIEWSGHEWTNWGNLDQAAQVIGVAIQAEKERQKQMLSQSPTADTYDPFLDENDLP